MTNTLDIIWGPLAILALVSFFVVMYFSAGKIYDLNIRMKEEYQVLFKLIGYNEGYLNERNKWIRHYRIYLALFGLLFLAILILLMRMLE